MDGRESRAWIPAGLGLALLAALPWLFAPFGTFWTKLATEVLIWSLFAGGVNLLFGYLGLTSFGQSLYFGIGAYGVVLSLQVMPLWPAMAIGVGAATLLAAVAGAFTVRLTSHYFTILTIILSLIFYFVAASWKSVTGGDDGMPFAPPQVFPFGGDVLALTNGTFQYYFVLVIVAACYLLMWRLVRSPLGRAFVAVRENDRRAALIGINPYAIRYVAFVLSGFICGTAGVLFALFSRYASAQYLGWPISGEGIIWSIIGGARYLFGPATGVVLMTALREEMSMIWNHHLVLVGLIVILAVIFAPQGMLGLFDGWLRRLRERRSR